MDSPTLGRAYLDGEVICRQGEVGDRMFILLDGAATVTVDEGTGEVFVREMGAGDIFGEMSIFERQPRSATVKALNQATVLTLDRSAFLRQLASDPSFAFRLLELMAGRIRTLSSELARAKTR